MQAPSWHPDRRARAALPLDLPGRASTLDPTACRRGRRGAASAPRMTGAARAPRRRDGGRPRRLVRRPARAASTTRALLPDADRLPRAASRVPASAGERVLVFGDFDADGLTGLAILSVALRRLGVDVEPYVPEPARRGPWPVARRDRARPCRRARGSSSPSTAARAQRAEIADRARARHRRHRHRPPPRAGRAAAGRRGRQPASGRQPSTRIGGWPAAASRSSSPSCCSPTCPAARPRRSTSPTWRRSAPSRTSRRSSARTAPSPGSGSSCSDRARGPASPRCSRGRGVAPGRRRPRDGRLRPRAAPQRRGPGGGGLRRGARSCCRGRGRGRGCRRGARGREQRRRAT